MRRTILAAAVLIVLVIPAVAPADPSGAPQSVDVAGDANGVNSQGRTEVQEFGNLNTAPASVDGADLREISFETLYTTVKERDAQGRVIRVRHVADALRVHLRTTGPATPTFGPGVIMRVAATVGGSCQAYFQLYVAGNLPGASTVERAELSRISNCGSAGSLIGFPHVFEGPVAKMTFPFASTAGLLADDVTIGPWLLSHTRVVAMAGTLSTTPFVLDQAPVLQPFVIGSDVPADIDCVVVPTHPACT